MPKIDDCATAFAGLPKVELHLHLDCSLNSAYARAYEPDLTLERFRAEFIAPVYAPDFAPYLRCANPAVALMQTTEALSGSIAELVRELADENVIYAEVRFAPHLHLSRGLRPGKGVRALVLYWVAPWVGILLADRYTTHHAGDASRRWLRGTPSFFVTTIVTIALFSSTGAYVGPITKLLGGVDVGYFAGFAIAFSWYRIAAVRVRGNGGQSSMRIHIVPGIWLEEPFSDADVSFARLRAEMVLVPEVVDDGAGPVTKNRDVAWFGDTGTIYRYAGSENIPLPWPPELARMRSELEVRLGVTLNSCLVGWYEDGSNNVEWHADDEPELCDRIVSVSLGATRTFKLRPSAGGPERDVPLGHGSVLVMTVASQQEWHHAVPPEPASGPRMNLTFRNVRIEAHGRTAAVR